VFTETDEYLWTDTAEFSYGRVVHLTIACDVGEVAEAAIAHARVLVDCTVLAQFYATQFCTVLNAIVLTYVGELVVKPG
jgi:hypothetical protein